MKRKYRNAEIVFDGCAPAELHHAPGGLDIPTEKQTLPNGEPSPYMDCVAVDSNRWKDPPHFALANLPLEDEVRVMTFLKTYGLSERFFSASERTSAFIDRASLRECQEELQVEWIRKAPICCHLRVDLRVLNGHLVFVMFDFWDYLRGMFLVDRSAGRTGVCKFEGCKNTRYFLKSRSDQQFCSKQCRALATMQAWRRRGGNRIREKEVRQKRERGKRQAKSRRRKGR